MATIYGLAKKISLIAGTAIVGKIGIDQTTDGTTNLVRLGAETTKVIGTVNIASAQTLATVTNLSQLGGAAIAMGTGVRSAGTQRVTIATDDVITIASADNANTASLTTTGNAQTFTNVQSFSSARVQITGTWTGTLTFQGSVNGTDFASIYAQDVGGTGSLVSTATANGTFLVNVAGLAKFRVYATAIGSGTAVVDTHLSIATGPVQISMPLPAGANAIGKLVANSGVTIGAVEIASAQTLATVTNLSQLGGAAIAMGTGVRSAGTQRVTIATDDVVPVSQSGTWTVGLSAGSNLVGKVGIDQTTVGTTNGVSIAQIGTGTIATVATGVMKVGIADSSGTAISSGTSAPAYNVQGLNVRPVFGDSESLNQSLSMASTANAVTLSNLQGISTVAVKVTGGTWTGTLIFEALIDGTNWDTVPAWAINTNSAITTTTANGAWQVSVSGCSAFRVRCSTTGTNSATVSLRGSIATAVTGRPLSVWTANPHVPAVNTQATKTQNAAGAGIKNVLRSIDATFSAGATAPTAVQVYVYVRDGASGSGTILKAWTFSLPATAGAGTGISLTGLEIVGSANTAMTVEFSAAGGLNTYEVVGFSGETRY